MVGKSALEVDVIWKSTQQLDLLLVVNCPPESAERRAEPLIHVVECPKKILDYILLSRGEICVANFKAPCEWCEFGQVFNGQLEHLGDWKTAESWPMLKFLGPTPLQAAEIIGGLLASE